MKQNTKVMTNSLSPRQVKKMEVKLQKRYAYGKYISMSKHFKIIRYLFAGGVSTGSNLFILFILVNYFELWYLTSGTISFCSAVIITYLLNKLFVFNNYSKENIHKQFTLFFIFQLIMLGVNTLLMYILVDMVGLWYMFAQAISSLTTAIINYIFFNKIVFKNT